MQNLHSAILAMSQLPISARRAKIDINISMHVKNAYQWRHNEKVRHDKQVYSKMLKVYYGNFSLIVHDQ
jgi:hypothetical protein